MACGMTDLAVAPAAPAAAAAAALFVAARALAHIGQQRELTCALDRARDLVLVPAARPRDATRADLAAVGDELPQGGDVLVVDELDLVAAVLAGLAASAAASGLSIPPARRPAALLRHWWKTSLVRLARFARPARARPGAKLGAGPNRVADRRWAGDCSGPRADCAKTATILRRNRRFRADPAGPARRLGGKPKARSPFERSQPRWRQRTSTASSSPGT